jgi:methionyl aminopeptidase
MVNRIKTADEIAAMRASGKINGQILASLKAQTQPGFTPAHMAAIARAELSAMGGEPAFLGFHGYPDVICISVNNQVQHAIPGNEPLHEGDVVNYDFGVRIGGMITDAGITVCVGKPDHEAARLLKGTEEALQQALKAVRAGVHVGDVSHVIEKTLRRYHLGIVRDLVGHGVGHELHEDPEIPNFGPAGRGPILEAGMTIAIEPIATLGSENLILDRDGWTLWTTDGSWAAQFEHTVLVTEHGCEILTKAP